LARLDKARAEEPLRQAHELFAAIGYRGALSETHAVRAEDEATAV
jgi:hypothetical protein